MSLLGSAPRASALPENPDYKLRGRAETLARADRKRDRGVPVDEKPLAVGTRAIRFDVNHCSNRARTLRRSIRAKLFAAWMPMNRSPDS